MLMRLLKRSIPIFLLLNFILFPIDTNALTVNNNVEDWLNSNNQPSNVTEDNNPINESSNQGEELVQGDRSLFLDFVKMVIALVIVLGLIYYLLKFIQKRSRIYQQTRSLENIGGLSLGSNKSVQVVRVGDEYFLLGVGEDVNLLKVIDDPNTISELTKNDTGQAESISFQKLLKNLQIKNNKNPYQAEETKRDFQTELQAMKNTRDRLVKRYQNRDERTDD